MADRPPEPPLPPPTNKAIRLALFRPEMSDEGIQQAIDHAYADRDKPD